MKQIIAILLSMGAIVVLTVVYFYSSTQSISENIYKESGYTLELIDSNLKATATVAPEWFNKKKTDVEEKVLQQGSSTVILESVSINENSDYILTFDIRQSFSDKEEGEFVSNYIRQDRTVRYKRKDQIVFYDNDGKEIKKDSILLKESSGPNERYTMVVDAETVDELEGELTVEFYYLHYQYRKE